MENQILNMILNSVNRIETKVDKIKDEMVTNSDCKNNQDNCPRKLNIKKIGMYTGLITAFFAGVAGILKIIYN